MKKILLLLLVASILFLAACQNKADPSEKITTDATTTQASGETVETDDPNGSDELPADLTFQKDGSPADFIILTQNYHAAVTDFVVDDNTTNTVEQNVFRRNAAVEERLGVFFEYLQKDYNQVNDTIRSLSVSDEKVDLISSRASWAFLMLTEGYFGDWKEVPYIHLEKTWWNQSSISELSVNEKAYILQGDINPSFITHTMCMYFNKNMVKSHLQDVDIFELVNNFDWTYDRFYSLIKDTWISDDATKDNGDTYGFVAQVEHTLRTMQFAFDMKPTAKTLDGFPLLNISTDKWSDVSQKLYTLLYDTEGVYVDSTWTDYRNMFAAGKALFVSGMFAHALLGYYANMTDEYAIIPFPMYDDSQETYYTGVDNACSSVYYLKRNTETEKLGAVCEALAAYSYQNISPNIYEVALKYRYSFSEEQRDMIDFIHNGISFDFGYIYNAAPMLSTLVGTNLSSDFASYNRKNYKTWETKITDFIDFYINGIQGEE